MLFMHAYDLLRAFLCANALTYTRMYIHTCQVKMYLSYTCVIQIK